MKDQILKLIFLVFMVILGCSEENEQITGEIYTGCKKITIEKSKEENLRVTIWHSVFENEMDSYLNRAAGINLL